MSDTKFEGPSTNGGPNGNFVQKEVRNELGVGDTYTIVTSETSDQRPIFRLIHKDKGLDIAWVVQIPISTFEKRHVKSPITVVLSELLRLIGEQKIVSITVTAPPIYMMNDDEIRAIYTNKDGRCPILDHRNERYAILEKLIDNHSTQEILDQNLSTKWVNEQAAITGKSRAKLYDTLHSYWAWNFSKNALLPDYWRSGGKGQERKQKRKLGRPNAKVLADGGANNGYSLSDVDKKKLCLGWRYFLGQGRTRHQAYLETMTAFYTERLEIQNGREVPILLHTDLRPTPAQFDRWGPDGNPRLTASRIQLGEIDWAKKYKGISGSAKDGILAVGMQAVCDTTTNDTYLKSVTNRLKTVGPVNRLLITESRSEMIIGLHCSFDAPSAKTFLLAVAHGASSKVDFCARYGIAIKEDDWPACFARTYLGDNGEYRNEFSLEALKQFGSGIDNIPSGQPQYNGTAESKHHVIHALLDHTLDGTTKGQPRRRGRSHPAINSCVNYYEYMRELIIEVLHHNNEKAVPHLLTAEMRRAQVRPTRHAIYSWLIESGYVVDFQPNIASLRAHLYPSVPATLTESGVYLLREDRGDKDERIPNARYMGEALIQFGLLEEARRKGNRRITVRSNPIDPRSVWLQTERGLAELQNIHPDPILYRQAVLADLIAIKDEDKVVELENRDQQEQARVVITSDRRAMLSQAQAEKKVQMAALGKPMKKSDHYSEMGKNRQDEISHLALQSDFQGSNHSKGLDNSKVSIELPGHPLSQGTETHRYLETHRPKQEATHKLINPARQALLKHIKEQNE